MTYARARLWLGITGVGLLVTIASLALAFDMPQRFMSEEIIWIAPVLQLASVTILFMLLLLPLDFLGGYLLPARYSKSNQSFGTWFRGYLPAAFLQGSLFVLFGMLILSASRAFGPVGGLFSIILLMIGCFAVRNLQWLGRATDSSQSSEKLLDAIGLIQSWQIFVPRTQVVKHKDIGFTGGIIGFGKRAQILIPEAWLNFSREQLATAVARRAVAINSGSYTRGLILAAVWNLTGFAICTQLSGANLSSVAGLVTTVCGFTIWSFIGLLTLPTISRNASLKIDQELVEQGMPASLIYNTAQSMDRMQDDEPDRPRLIETIFHPVPNVNSRNRVTPIRGFSAWNVARTTLFFSWACLGFLSRSVHCNVGRPELWTMLPSD